MLFQVRNASALDLFAPQDKPPGRPFSLLDQIIGHFGEGMVTAEAVKHNGEVYLNFLALDTLPTDSKQSETIVIVVSRDSITLPHTQLAH